MAEHDHGQSTDDNSTSTEDSSSHTMAVRIQEVALIC